MSDKHLNGNLLCSVAIRSTGIYPRHNDLCEISILPFNEQLQISSKMLPYIMNIQPVRMENINYEEIKKLKIEDNNLDYKVFSISKEMLKTYVLSGVEESKAADLLVKWCEKNIPKFPTKRIMPVGYRWDYISQFIEDWLGPKTFNLCFDQRGRDIHSIALFMNDRAGWREEVQYPFAKTNFRYICNRMNANHTDENSSLADAVALVTCYRNMTTTYF